MPPTGLGFLKSLNRPAFVAMIHVGALPGTPRSEKSVRDLARAARDEARLLADCGADAIILENMHDAPYLNRAIGPEIVSAMTTLCLAARSATDLPLGVQVLAGANREALAVAHAADCQFIRCEGFVFAHVADEGLMPDADAGPLLRYRRMIGAEKIAIIADVKKKHSAHALTADVSLAESAKAAVFFGADAVVVTGVATGEPTRPADVQSVAEYIDEPVFVGSGAAPDQVAELAPFADALIVGSYLKKDGRWYNPPDPRRVRRMAAALRAIKRTAQKK